MDNRRYINMALGLPGNEERGAEAMGKKGIPSLHFALNLAFICITVCFPAACENKYAPLRLENTVLPIQLNGMTGEPWDVEPLSRKEVEVFLSIKLPDINEVSSTETVVDVLEKHCGKRVLWIPKEMKYQRVKDLYNKESIKWITSGKNKFETALTVGEALSRFLGLWGPRVGEGDGPWFADTRAEKDEVRPAWQPHFGDERYKDLYFIATAIITKENLIIIAVPRDYTKRDIP